MSVVVKYKSKTIGDIDSDEPIIIDLSEKDFNLPWLPFYKRASYSFTVTAKKVLELKNELSTAKLDINGSVTVSGKYTFIGICSRKQIEKVILEKVMNEIYKEAKKNFSK